MDGQPPRAEDRFAQPASEPGMARQYATATPDEPARRKSLVTGLVVGIICGGIVGGIAGAMLSNGYGYPRSSGQRAAGEGPGVPGVPPGAVYGTNEGTNGNGKMTGDEVRKNTQNGYGTPLFPNTPAPQAGSPGTGTGPGTNEPAPQQQPPAQPQQPRPGSGGPQ